MRLVSTTLPDVFIVEPQVYGDRRGFFLEAWNERTFRCSGLDVTFRQDNHSRSVRGVLRGLHYQLSPPQGKLVRCARGAIFDVAVDLRRSSPHFGKAAWVRLDDENHRMLWIPPGFAHGFLVLSDVADVFYKATEYYEPKSDRTLAWNDPTLGIPWPLDGEPVLSDKDTKGTLFPDAETYP